MTDKNENDGNENTDTPVTKSGEDARQGRPGRPVLSVLIAGTVLGIVALAIAYFLTGDVA